MNDFDESFSSDHKQYQNLAYSISQLASISQLLIKNYLERLLKPKKDQISFTQNNWKLITNTVLQRKLNHKQNLLVQSIIKSLQFLKQKRNHKYCQIAVNKNRSNSDLYDKKSNFFKKYEQNKTRRQSEGIVNNKIQRINLFVADSLIQQQVYQKQILFRGVGRQILITKCNNDQLYVYLEWHRRHYHKQSSKYETKLKLNQSFPKLTNTPQFELEIRSQSAQKNDKDSTNRVPQINPPDLETIKKLNKIIRGRKMKKQRKLSMIRKKAQVDLFESKKMLLQSHMEIKQKLEKIEQNKQETEPKQQKSFRTKRFKKKPTQVQSLGELYFKQNKTVQKFVNLKSQQRSYQSYTLQPQQVQLQPLKTCSSQKPLILKKLPISPYSIELKYKCETSRRKMEFFGGKEKWRRKEGYL